MIVDNLPGATEIPPALSGEEDIIFYETGWPVGGHYCPNKGGKIVERCPGKRKYYLHNHYKYEDRIPQTGKEYVLGHDHDGRWPDSVGQCGKQKTDSLL